MNARSRFLPLRDGVFFNHRPATEEVTDCRGHTRTIKKFTGVNKGKTYKYCSKKQGG